MTATKREALVRCLVGVFCIAAEAILFFLNGELYLYDLTARSVLLLVFPILAGLCVLFPTQTERREKRYRLSSPVRLALDTAVLGLIIALAVLIGTASDWDAIGYFFILFEVLILALPLFLISLGCKLKFGVSRRREAAPVQTDKPYNRG